MLQNKLEVKKRYKRKEISSYASNRIIGRKGKKNQSIFIC